MYEHKAYETIKEDILKNIKDLDKREGSFVHDMISPIAMELEGTYQQFDKLLGIMFLEDAIGDYLEKRAGEYGIKRKQGTQATATATFTGAEGTTIPKGAILSTLTNLLYETTQAGTIPAGQTQLTLPIQAQQIGTKYNVPAHTITQIPVALNGITAVTNPVSAQGGSNLETDEELLSRTLIQIQNPATSGNAMHYKLWCMEVDGVGDAKVQPLHNGNGTVRVMPITNSKRSVDETIIQNIQRHIEAERPIGVTVTVEPPTEVLINVNAQVVLENGYTLSQVTENYKKSLEDYIKGSVFKLYNVDYYKCLSLMYEVEGVKQVVDFKVNQGTTNINIQETQIQVTGNVTLTQ